MATDKEKLRENKRYSLVPFYYWHIHTLAYTYIFGLVTHFLSWTIRTAQLYKKMCRGIRKKLNYLTEAGFSNRFITFYLCETEWAWEYLCACVCQGSNCYCCCCHANLTDTNTMLHNETLLTDTKDISEHMIESMKSSCHILIGKKR